MPDWYQPVPGAMNNICVAIDATNPLISSQMISQNITDRQNWKETFHHPREIIIRRIQDQVTRFVFRCDFRCKTAAHTSAINNNVVFAILFQQRFVDELHIAEHLFFASLSRAFSKATIIDEHYIIVVAVEVTGIPCPTFYAPRVSMKVKDKTEWVLPVKVKTINTNTWLYIKKQFFERNIILEEKVLLQFFRLENKFFLEKVNDDRQTYKASDNIPNEVWQVTKDNSEQEMKSNRFLSALSKCMRLIFDSF